MPRSPWSVAGEALVTVAMLIVPAWLASLLGWPLGEHTTWTWFLQYLRGGTIPDEVVIAVLVVALWGLWAVHLVVVALDIVALLRGLVPRVGLVRLVWVLAAGGATATSTQTAAVAAQTHTVAEAPAQPGPQSGHAPEQPVEEQESGVIDRTRNLSGFAFDSDELTPEMKDSLKPTVAMISDFGLPEAPVVVTGHTDPVGVPAYNQVLSEQRAQAVADYLAEHLEDVEFEVRGAGSSQPPDYPQMSYEGYRRVEISYSLQRPIAPQAATEPEADRVADVESAPEQAQMDVGTTSQGQGPNVLLVGAAAGVAGVGVGYAAGRRRGSARRTRPASRAHAPERQDEEDLASEPTENTEPDVGGLLCEDPHSVARGVIDEDGFVLVADTVRVSGRQGLGFAGAHASLVLGAVVADHSPGPVVVTRAAAAALGGAEAMPPGARVVADVPGARIAVEAEVLTAERCRMDDEDSPQSDQRPSADHPWVLVVCDASDLATESELLQTLTATPTTVVSVLGNHDALGAVVQCDDLDRPHLAHSRGKIDLPLPLRHRIRADTDGRTPIPSPSCPDTTSAPQPVPEPVTERHGDENTSETTHRIQVRLFAPEPELTLDGEPVTGLRAVARTLLAFLALHPEGADAEQIADVCFADTDPAKAAGHRRNAIHSLRTTLRKQLGIPGEQIVLSDQGLYRIDESVFDVDLWEFLRLAAALRKDGEYAHEGHLERMLAMHQENLLGGRKDEWIPPVRERCVKEVVDVCVRLAESTDSGSDRILFLEKAISFDEYNEPLYQRIMMACRDVGSPEGANRAYRDLKERLEILGETPSRESRRIVQDCVPASL